MWKEKFVLVITQPPITFLLRYLFGRGKGRFGRWLPVAISFPVCWFPCTRPGTISYDSCCTRPVTRPVTISFPPCCTRPVTISFPCTSPISISLPYSITISRSISLPWTRSLAISLPISFPVSLPCRASRPRPRTRTALERRRGTGGRRGGREEKGEEEGRR